MAITNTPLLGLPYAGADTDETYAVLARLFVKDGEKLTLPEIIERYTPTIGSAYIKAADWTAADGTADAYDAKITISGVEPDSMILIYPATDGDAEKAKRLGIRAKSAPGVANDDTFIIVRAKGGDPTVTEGIGLVYIALRGFSVWGAGLTPPEFPTATVIGVDPYIATTEGNRDDIAASQRLVTEAVTALRSTLSTLTTGLSDTNKAVELRLKSADLPTKLDEYRAAKGLIDKTVSDLVNYYTKSQTLTKDEINALVSAIPKFKIEVVTSLPTSNISETTVYLVKSGDDDTNLYTEYIHKNGKWEKLGTQTVDLTGYATEAWVNDILASYVKTVDMEAYVSGVLGAYITKDVADKTYQPAGDYVEKEEGKQLSTLDYNASEQARVNKAVADAADSKTQAAAALNRATQAETAAQEVQRKVESGELDGAPGAPGYTPVAGVDYPTDAQFDAKIAAALAERNQLEPLVAESEDWLNANGDPTKVYIVPNADGQGGKVFAYAEVEGEVTKTIKDAVCGPETQQIDHWVADAGYSTGSRLGSDGTVKAGIDQASGYIPAAVGSTIRVENLALTPNQICYVVAYNESGTVTGSQTIQNKNNGSEISTAATSNKWCDTKTASSFTATLSAANFGSGFSKIRINGVLTNATVIVATVQKISRWYPFTDFVATDDARINAIDDRLKVLEAGGASRVKTREAALRVIKEWDKPIYDQLEPFMLDHVLSVDNSRYVTYTDTQDADGSKRRAQVTALYEEYDDLCTSYPDFVREITDVAHGLEGATETTYGGLCSDGVQKVKVYEFREVDPLRNEANNEWSETKPKMILISGIHWEWGGVYALFYALKEITTNPALRYIRRNMHFIVLPITNPYTFTSFGDTGTGHYNKNGVEIHNNFEVDFDNESDSTHGPEPLSEVETRYINNVMRKHPDAAFLVSAHSHQGNADRPNRSIWPSTATYFGCNLGYRLIDIMSFALAQKYGTNWSGYNRAGHASLSSSSGTEGKQAMLYGIHGMSLEIGDTFYAFSTDKLSNYVITHGAETYINFIRVAMTAYSIHDRDQYAPKPAYEIEE